jgi:hypothetical protein
MDGISPDQKEKIIVCGFDHNGCKYVDPGEIGILYENELEDYLVTSALDTCKALTIHFPKIEAALMAHLYSSIMGGYAHLEKFVKEVSKKDSRLFKEQAMYTYFDRLSRLEREIVENILKEGFKNISPSDFNTNRDLLSIVPENYLFINKHTGDIIKENPHLLLSIM